MIRLAVHPIILLILAGILPSCGLFDRGNNHSSSTSTTQDSEDQTAYEGFHLKPSPGKIAGPALIEAAFEDGTEIYFAFHEWKEPKDAQQYKRPIYLVPPASIWIAAVENGKLGKVYKIRYEEDGQNFPKMQKENARRLVSTHEYFQIPSLSEEINIISPRPKGLKIKIDGQCEDWDEELSSSTIDPQFDTPKKLGQVDLTSIKALEESGDLKVAMTFRSEPDQKEHTVYGFDIGPSGITSSSFGEGTDFRYKIEIRRNKIAIYPKHEKTSQQSPDGDVRVGSCVEVSIPFKDLGKLKGERQLALRAYSADVLSVPAIIDRALPLYLRSNLSTSRSTSKYDDQKRTLNVDFHVEPDTLFQPYIVLHHSLIHDIVKHLGGMNQIPLYSYATIPLFFTSDDTHGFSGINSTDRGILTTYGPFQNILAHGQLLAHEVAHFQNSGSGRIVSRWLQEGLSEWTAERYLYQQFPARAVHNYIYQLRTKPLLNSKKTEFPPLDTWESPEPPDLAYERAYAFMSILSKEVGDDAIVEVARMGFHERMDSKTFQKRLEEVSGKNLDALFKGWVFKGPTNGAYELKKLFVDLDGDELTQLDEKLLGTSDNVLDSDSDGFLDSEEVFLDPPNGKNSDTSKRFVYWNKPEMSPLLRIAGFPIGSDTKVRLGPISTFENGWETNGKLRLLREPVSLTIANSQTSLNVELNTNHDLPIENGNGILPKQKRTSPMATSLNSTPSGKSILISDSQDDMPHQYDSYNLTSTRVSVTEEGHLDVELSTVDKPDPFGAYGYYFLELYSLAIQPDTQPILRRVATMQTNVNIPTWNSQFENESESLKDISLDFGRTLKIRIKSSLLSNWLNNGSIPLVCTSGRVKAEKSSSFTDQGGCAQLEKENLASYSFTGGERGGMQQLHFRSNAQPTLRNRMVQFVGNALLKMNDLLGRSHLDRNVWPVNYFTTESDVYFPFNNGIYGVSLSAPAPNGVFTETAHAFLLAEQLARLVIQDYIERQKTAVPLWIQEFFVQWTALSIIYQLEPTKNVHDYIRKFRIGHYLCYYTQGCAQNLGLDTAYFNENNQPVESWRNYFDGSLSHQRMLMLIYYLDMKLGSKVMSQTMNQFANKFPSSQELKAWLKAAADPASSQTIDQAWLYWVEGRSGDSSQASFLLQTFIDSNNDGIYDIEAQTLTESGIDPIAYFQ